MSSATPITPNASATSSALILAALMCALPPLVNIHVLPLPSFYEEWLAAALGTAACAATLFASRRQPFVAPVLLLPLFGLLAVFGLHAVLGRVAYVQQASLAALYVVFAFAMVWCGTQLRHAVGIERVAHVVALGLCLGGFVSGLIALFQAYAPDSPLAPFVSRLIHNRTYGNLNQPNLFADLLALAAVALAYLYRLRRIRRPLAVAVALVLLCGLSLSGSRAVWFYAAFLLAWTGALALIYRSAQYRRLTLQIGAAIAVLVVLGLVLPPVVGWTESDTALNRLASMNIGANRSDGARFYFWQQALMMFQSAPLLGVGVGQFPYAFMMQSPGFAELGFTGQERNAHNLVLHLLAETGLIGALSVLAAVVWGFWRILRAPESPERWWLVGSLGIVTLHSLVEYPLWYADFLGPFALLLGIGQARIHVLKSRLPALSALAASVAIGALTLASLLHGVGEMRRWVYSVPREALADPAILERQRQVMLKLEPTLLRPYIELPLAGTLAVNAEDLEEKLAFNERVLRFCPIPPVLFRHVIYLTLAQRYEEAFALYERGAVLYPSLAPAFEADVQKLLERGLAVEPLQQYLVRKQGNY